MILGMADCLAPTQLVCHWQRHSKKHGIICTCLQVTSVIKESFVAYTSKVRADWTLQWPAQMVLCVATLHWTQEVCPHLHVPLCIQMIMSMASHVMDLVNKPIVFFWVSLPYKHIVCLTLHGEILLVSSVMRSFAWTL